MQYKVVLESSDEGYSVSVPGLPGCHSQGATEQEALDNIADAIREYQEVASELARRSPGSEVGTAKPTYSGGN
jgi:predicted RNase H-like HicB family nuclease